MTKEIIEAKEYSKKLNIEMKRDNFIFEIIEILNTITVEFYDEMRNKLRFLFKRDNNRNIIQINHSHNLSNFNDFN